MEPLHLPLADYDYPLPADRIANHPLEDRGASRLLTVDKRTGALGHRAFADLPSLLPANARLVLNDTRVIRARVELLKKTGGAVEMLLLEPRLPSVDPQLALQARDSARWACLLSGRKIVPGDVFSRPLGEGALTATVVTRQGPEAVVDLRWPPSAGCLVDVLTLLGLTPLPPYIKRAATAEDVTRYQTVYAAHDGSVAAPTAGLHFTPPLMDTLRSRGVSFSHVTLHVGAGTFRPVQDENAAAHVMHAERATVSHAVISDILDDLRGARPVIPVGTTSLRTLESVHWMGARLLAEEDIGDGKLAQWDWRRLQGPAAADTYAAVDAWLTRTQAPSLVLESQLMVTPGYPFGVARGLITNFHQPCSTLVMLVAAFVGAPLWRTAYDAALAGGYRFLSYGDSSLLKAWD
jgi:S-adenosylmethionine:tRNA ribosyltransferase-isomerase